MGWDWEVDRTTWQTQKCLSIHTVRPFWFALHEARFVLACISFFCCRDGDGSNTKTVFVEYSGKQSQHPVILSDEWEKVTTRNNTCSERSYYDSNTSIRIKRDGTSSCESQAGLVLSTSATLTQELIMAEQKLQETSLKKATRTRYTLWTIVMRRHSLRMCILFYLWLSAARTSPSSRRFSKCHTRNMFLVWKKKTTTREENWIGLKLCHAGYGRPLR